MYRLLSKLYPKGIRNNYEVLMDYLNFEIDTEIFLGVVFFFTFGVSLVLTFLISKIINFPFLLIFIILFITFQFLVYIIMLLKVDSKARFVEDILPDVLQLMSSNLKAGMTTGRALILSARPEFGPFQEEINQIGKEIVLGKELDEALLDTTKRIRSDKLKKTVLLIITGLNSGGELASLLDQTAQNLRQERFIEEKMRSSVMMYVIFIFFAIGLGAPMLFGLSSFLVEVLTKNLSLVDIPQTSVSAALPLSFGKVSISLDFVIMYALVSLVVTSILGSLILGLISKGKEKRGIKYIPLLIGLSIAVFFSSRFLIKTMIGSLFGLV